MNCDRYTKMAVSRFLSGHLRSLAFQGGHTTHPICPKCNIKQASPTPILGCLEDEKGFNDDHREEITDFVQSIPGFQECVEEGVESWMACDAEDCGFQMLNEDDIVTSVKKRIPTMSTMKRMKARTTTTKVPRVRQMLTRFLR
ncbi:uncharacterized protein TNCV_1206051 [Trichonephila clavipes]|nr:uncharacterized protein TNCV_1206051 [Trichonephila clavipes]